MLNDWCNDVLFHISMLWESCGDDERWKGISIVTVELPQTSSGKLRDVSVAFKRHLIIEARNARGSGISSAKQLLVGFAVGQTKTAAVKMSSNDRATVWKGAKSTSGVKPGDRAGMLLAKAHNLGNRALDNEMYNYFVTCGSAMGLVLSSMRNCCVASGVVIGRIHHNDRI